MLLEFPDESEGGNELFTYSFYLRGGGAENEGMDLNELCFERDGLLYCLYDNYISAQEVHEAFLVIRDANGRIEEIHGLPGSISGSLVPLREFPGIRMVEP